MTYYGILSEADCIEIFPDEQTRSEILQYYYDIEFECSELDVNVSHRGELEEWVEKEYTGVSLEFANPHITRLRIENHRLRQRVDELDDALGKLEYACSSFANSFLSNL